ncbi:tRNA (adenosine(37)-N6)-threonylcarbamoyltransferase complex ATPase subunit type 1 TsaE [Paenibacillus sp. HB172176]|uniref:tRNA (adenosine(37)-N6)-threonylcarbamoyltransferase complex ATPase subunit type 1 TsaE n=1 Tax=Paenibacillus sp. HB172176 TaxID=2493690 RepID=UPI00143B308F|nr:tRNA (adenosine(37)-N6)-threonylcarbamoyltransferase complex ATPase subunit type 1 TsaE [Paenibacillus sp. HB172176]
MEQRTVTAEINVRSIQDTASLAEWLASRAFPGALLALDGDLGAGKTTLSQAFAAALGVPGIVNSPTFTIIKEYRGSSLPLYHMDVYRVTLEEADELGLDEYFYGEGVTIVEWASIIDELLPPQRLDIYIEHMGGELRRIRLAGSGEPYAEWCEEWNRMGATTK